MKGEQVFEIKGKRSGITILDISDHGIKFSQNSDNQATGKLNAAGPSTVNIQQKTDGTSEWEQKGFLSTMEGDFIATWGKGSGKQTSPTTAEWSGELSFMSQCPKLAWLNGGKGWVEGQADQMKGESWAKVYEWK